MKTLILVPHRDNKNLSQPAKLFREWQLHFEQELLKLSSASIDSLNGSQVTRPGVQNALHNPDSDVILYLGHGLSCCLLGPTPQGSQPGACRECHAREVGCTVEGCEHVILDRQNFRSMDGRLIFMFACAAAKSLGRTMRDLRSTQSGYFGFTKRIYIAPRHATTRILRDILTEVFGILHGRDGEWRQRFDRARQHFLDSMRSAFIQSEEDKDLVGMFVFSHLQRHFDAHPN